MAAPETATPETTPVVQAPEAGEPAEPTDPVEKKRLKRERTRAQVAREIVTSEESYVDAIKAMNDKLINPLNEKIAQGEINVTRKAAEQLFGTLPLILALNQKFLADLKARVDDWETNSVISDVFHTFTPYFKMYTSYVDNHDEAVNRYRRLKASDAAFLEIVNAFEASPESKMQSLESFMILPIQRIPRYELLLRELLRNTEPDHPDFAGLTSAFEIIQAKAKAVNESLRDRQNREQVIAIQNQFTSDVNLVAPSRRFIRQGLLTKVCRNKDKTYEFVLFNDLLIYAARTVGGLKLHRRMDIGGAFVVQDLAVMSESDPHPQKFQLVSKGKSFVVYSDTKADKDQWLTLLNECIQGVQSSQATLRHRGGAGGAHAHDSSAELAPVWQTDRSSKACTLCSKTFTVWFRRHHCRKCGCLVCSNCSKTRAIIKAIDDKKSQRLCDACVFQLRRSATVSKARESVVQAEVQQALDQVPENAAAEAAGAGAVAAAGGAEAVAAGAAPADAAEAESAEAPAAAAPQRKRSAATTYRKRAGTGRPAPPVPARDVSVDVDAEIEGVEIMKASQEGQAEATVEARLEQEARRAVAATLDLPGVADEVEPDSDDEYDREMFARQFGEDDAGSAAGGAAAAAESDPASSAPASAKQAGAAAGATAASSRSFARVLFAHTPSGPEELPLERGDVIRVLVREEQGWWSGQLVEGDHVGRRGIFLSAYVQPYDPANPTPLPDPDDDEDQSPSGRGSVSSFDGGPAAGTTDTLIMVVIAPYAEPQDGELSLAIGQEVRVLEQHESGWWRGLNRATGVSGWFSRHYVDFAPTAAPTQQFSAARRAAASSVAASGKVEAKAAVAASAVSSGKTEAQAEPAVVEPVPAAPVVVEAPAAADEPAATPPASAAGTDAGVAPKASSRVQRASTAAFNPFASFESADSSADVPAASSESAAPAAAAAAASGPRDGACGSFELHSFKPGFCRNCGKSSDLH